MTVNQVHGAPATAEDGPWHWPVPRDPGDLSRRLAARRAELRLSLSQVARRARIEPRYLAYLENFPGQPGAATLRQLAAALCTTSAALLGAGQEAPPGRDPREGMLGFGGRDRAAAPGGVLPAARAAGDRPDRLRHRCRAGGPAGELRGDGAHHRDQDRLGLAHRRARRRPGLLRGRPLRPGARPGMERACPRRRAPGPAAGRAAEPPRGLRPAAVARRGARPVRQDRPGQLTGRRIRSQ